MTVENPHRADAKTADRMKTHLSREPAREPHVVVPRYHVDRETTGEQCREELKQLSPYRGGHSDDRLLEVPGEKEGFRPRVARDLEKLLGHLFRSSSGGTRLTGAVTAQTEMRVGSDEKSPARGACGGHMEHRMAEHRPGNRKFHTRHDKRIRHESCRSDSPDRRGLAPAGLSVSIYIQPVADSV